MTKITKRIWLAICSCAFAVCLAFTGWIFADTNKPIKADAASTVTFTEFGSWNNTLNGYSLTTVSLKFSGTFTSSTSPVSSITYTVPGGSPTTFNFVIANTGGTWATKANEISLTTGDANPLPENSVLTIAEGTVVGGQTLPALSFEVQNGVWVKVDNATVVETATFNGIGTKNNEMIESASSYNGVHLQFSGTFEVGFATSGYESKIYYTVPGSTDKTPFPFIGYGGQWGETANTLMPLTLKTNPIPEGSVLTVVKGTEIGGVTLPAVSLTMVQGKWATVKLTGFGTKNNEMIESVSSYNGVHLQFSGTFEVGFATSGYESKIYYTVPGSTDKTPFPFIGYGGQWGETANTLMPLTLNTNPIPEGSILTIAPGTQIGGQTLPAMTLELVGSKWQLPPTVSFTGIDQTENNDQWNTGGDFLTLALNFSGDFKVQQLDGENAPAGITYTTPGGAPKTFAFNWANNGNGAKSNQLVLLNKGATPLADGTILNIEKNTEIGGQRLPALTLRVENGKWQIPSTVSFEDIGAKNNTPHDSFKENYNAVDLVFSGDFVEGYVQCDSNATYNDKIYYTAPNSDVKRFDFIDLGTQWGGNANTLSLMTNINTSIPAGSVLTIVGGTEIGGQVLPGRTLYMWSDNTWHTEKQITFSLSESNNNSAHPQFKENFNTVDLIFSEAFTTSGNVSDGSFNASIYYTTSNGSKSYFQYVAWGNNQWIDDAMNTLHLMTNIGTTIPVGAVLTIEKDTVIGGLKLPEVKLYMHSDKKWHTTAPVVIENDDCLVTSGNSVAITFNTVLSAAGTTDSLSGLTGTNVTVTGASVEAGSSVLTLTYDSLPAFDESVTQIKLELATKTTYGDVSLEPFTLYYNKITGAWQLEEYTYDASASVANFDSASFDGTMLPGNDESQRRLNIPFDVAIATKNSDYWGAGKNGNTFATNSGSLMANMTIEGVEASITNMQFLVGLFVNASESSSNVLEIFFQNYSFNKLAHGAKLHIPAGTEFCDVQLNEVTLYYNASADAWQTKKPTNYIGFTTEEGGSIRVSGGHDGLRFETHITYAAYNALVKEYGGEANVELGTYILPKHYLEAYIATVGGDLLSYVTTQTEGVHFNKISTWDEGKEQNGFINRATAEADGYYAYYGAITKIQLHNYTTEFIGVGYLKIGDELYLTHEGDWSRNVYYIAEQAYVDKENGDWQMADSTKPALLEYLSKVVVINSVGDKLEDNLDRLLETRPATVTKGYVLTLNATTGVITIEAGDKGLGGVVIDGQKLGAIAANETKYTDYYSVNRALENSAADVAAMHFGIVEPTQELWGTGGSDLWDADKSTNDGTKDKTKSDWPTADLNANSTAANIAKVTSAMNGDTARIWMNTLDFVWGSPSDANGSWNERSALEKGLNPGATAVLKKVIDDSYKNGATNISVMSGIAELSTTYNMPGNDGAWYDRWGNKMGGGTKADGVTTSHVAGLIVLPSDSDYENFLLLQRAYFKQLALVCGDKVTVIEISNELDNGGAKLTRKGYVNEELGIEGGTVTQAELAQAVMDICRMATLGVQDAGKNIKIAMPALTCVGGSADFFTAQYTSINGSRNNNNLSDDMQALFTTDADDYFQIINIHPYVFLSSDTSDTNYLYKNGSDTAESYTAIKNRWASYVGSLRTIAVNNGDSEKPFWITELGIADYEQCSSVSLGSGDWKDYKDNTVARQMRAFQAVYDAMKDMPYIDTVMIFRLGDYAHDNSNDAVGDGKWYSVCGEASYGILNTDGTLKDFGKYLYAMMHGVNIWNGTVGGALTAADSLSMPNGMAPTANLDETIASIIAGNN